MLQAEIWQNLRWAQRLPTLVTHVVFICECGFTLITLTFAFYQIYIYIYIIIFIIHDAYLVHIKQAAGKGLKYLEAHEENQRPKARLLANSKMTLSSITTSDEGVTAPHLQGSLALLTAKIAASASQAAGNSSPHAFTGHQHCSYQVRRERDVDQLVNIIIVILRWNWCTELNIASHKKKRSFILMLMKYFKEKQHLKCR